MTEMKRVTSSLPDEIDKKIIELKKQDTFVRCSYSEIVRILISAGINSELLGSRWGGEPMTEDKLSRLRPDVITTL